MATQPTPAAPDFSDAAQFGLAVSDAEPKATRAQADFSDAAKFGLTVSAAEPKAAAADFSDAGKFGLTVSDDKPQLTPSGAQMDASARKLIPPELRGYTPEELAKRIDTSNPLSPVQSVSLGETVNNPYRRGLETVAEGVARVAADPTDWRGPAKIVKGTVGFASEPMLGLAAVSPMAAAEMAGWYGVSHGLQTGGTEIAKRSGMNPEDSSLVGDVAGALPLAVGAIRTGAGELATARAQVAAESAAKWQALGDRMEPGRAAAGPGADPIQVSLKGPNGPEPGVINFAGLGADGRPYSTVTNLATGKIVFAGNGQGVGDWLGQRAADPGWLAKWNTSTAGTEFGRGTAQGLGDPQAISEIVRPATTFEGGGRTLTPADYPKVGALSPEPVAPVESPLTDPANVQRTADTLAVPPDPTPPDVVRPAGLQPGQPGLYDSVFEKLKAGQPVNARWLAAKPFVDSGQIANAADFNDWVAGVAKPRLIASSPAASSPTPAVSEPPIPAGFSPEPEPSKPTKPPAAVSVGSPEAVTMVTKAPEPPIPEGFSAEPPVAPVASTTEAKPATREPWQMTRAEWMAQRPAGTSPGMHLWEIRKALAAGEDVPAAVLADYPAEKAAIAPVPSPTPEATPATPAVATTSETPEIDKKQISETPQPGSVVRMDPNLIKADPARFQFKADTGGKAGVGETLKHLQRYNPNLGGLISVWHDPADGKTYVVNGHHRLELAKRTGAPSVNVQYLDAKDAADAYTTGALINIAEGRGTAIDAAKVFRQTQMTPEELESEHGVSLRDKIAREGMALSHLAEPIFTRVVQGDLPIERAAVIGETLPDHQEQRAALKLLDQAEARGKRPTNDQVREMIRFVKGAPKVETQDENFSLFGEDTISKNLALEKAEVSDYIKQQLSKTRRLFASAGTPSNADLLGKSGNVIKAEENARIAQATSEIQAVYDKLSLSAGPISEALDRAAAELAAGTRSAAEVKKDALDRVTEAVARTLPGRRGTPPAQSLDSAGSSGTPGGGSSATSAAEAGSAEDDDDAPLRIVESRRRSTLERTEPQDVRQLGFYSQLERVVDTKMPAKTSSAQAYAIVTNPQSGIKADELKWSGLADWLAAKKGQVTKAEIQQFLAENKIVVTEKESANRAYRAHVLPGMKKRADVSDWNHISPDDEKPHSYRELLFELASQPQPAHDATAAYRGELEKKYGGDFFKIYDQLTPEENAHEEKLTDARYAEYAARPNFTAPHFTTETKNLLAHARVTDRTGAAGEAVLMAEEIQSDLHQKGRDKGYQERTLPRDGSIVWDRAKGEGVVFDIDSGRTRKFQATTPEELAKAVGPDYADKLLKSGLDSITVNQRNQVPDLPFAKTWHEFVFRRLLRLAAEEGYDKLAWTTGKQQADRYNLAQHVSGIAYDPETEGLFIRRHPMQFEEAPGWPAQGGGEDWEAATDNNTVAPEKLPDYIGKDAARKLLASEPRSVTDNRMMEGGRRLHVIEGDDLQVGGLGMNAAYDQILTSYATKYGKKWGATVGTTEILGEPFHSPTEGFTHDKQTVHSIDITPAMKKSVMEGQPLFALRKNPRLSTSDSSRGAPFSVGQSDDFHAERARYETTPLEGKDAAVADALVTNVHGLEFAGRVTGAPADRIGRNSDAFTIQSMELAPFIKRLFAVIDRGGLTPAINTLLKQANAARKAGKSLILVADDPSALPTAFTEEIDHAIQIKESGDLYGYLGDQAHAFVESFPEGNLSKTNLEGRYAFATDGHAAAEIVVRLMRGDIEDLQLSKRQYVRLANEAVRILKQEYGEHGTPRTIEKIDESLRGIRERPASPPDRLAENAPPDDDGSEPISAKRRDARPDDDEQQDSLFGSSAPAEAVKQIEQAVAEYKDTLEKDRLTAQLNAPLTREEQLRKLKRSKEKKQTDLFAPDEDEAAQGSFTLGSGFGALQPYFDKFLTKHVTPTAKNVGEAYAASKDDILKWLAPAAREGAEATALNVRAKAAELARSTDRAEAALAIAGKYFSKQKPDDNFAFMDRVEKGEPQPNPHLQGIHDALRAMLDQRAHLVQALGTGKLQTLNENYFPHLWDKPQVAHDLFVNEGKKPLEGSKSFLKKRSIDTIAYGRAHGLTPVSDNPVELTLLKVREMDRFLMGHHIFAEEKRGGRLTFVDARDRGPHGYIKVEDPMATVYGPSEIPISEYVNKGIWDGLNRVLKTLDISHQRKMKLPGNALGLARRARGVGIETKFASDEQTLAHEIGHHIEFQFPFIRNLMRHPDKETRKTLKLELRALADLRFETNSNATPYYKKYVRIADEKAAAVVQAYVMARDKFRQVAPNVLGEFNALINRHPDELGGLRRITPSMEHHEMTGKVDAGGLVIRGHWWGPEPAVRILNNFLSPGLREKSIVYRGLLSAGNSMNQAQLGFSAFHLSFTTIDVATSKLALSLYQAAHGDIVKGLKSAAAVPISPVTNLMRGDKMLKEWDAPGTQSALIGQLVDAAVQAGGRAHMDRFYETEATKKMMAAFRAHKWFMGGLRIPFAVIEQAARPIMEYIVPRQKMGVFADMAQYELARLGPNAAAIDVSRALAKAWDSVDNRLGQVVYDNLFWHKTIKDLSMLSVRSVGWNVGTIREVGGGWKDTAKFLGVGAKRISAAGRDVPMEEKNDEWSAKGPEFTHRMAYIIAMHLLGALAGGLAYYLWHGHAPRKLADYFFPVDARGKRWTLPTYAKDEYEWTHDPAKTLRSKIHPFLTMLWEMVDNRDYFDKPIMNPHSSLVKRAEQEAIFILKEYESIGLRTNSSKTHHTSTEERALGFFGVKPAPKALGQLGQ